LPRATRCSLIPRSRAPVRRSSRACCSSQPLVPAAWRDDGARAMAYDTLLVAGSWAAAMLRSSTPLMMVTLGETLTQRVGIVNLGIEGQMLCGACVGFAVAAQTGSPVLGLAAGAIAGLVLSLVHGVLCLGCEANQIGSGIAVWARTWTDLLFRPLRGRRKGQRPRAAGGIGFDGCALCWTDPDAADGGCADGDRHRHDRGSLALSHPDRPELAGSRRIVPDRAGARHPADDGASAGYSRRRNTVRLCRRHSLGRLHPDLGQPDAAHKT